MTTLQAEDGIGVRSLNSGQLVAVKPIRKQRRCLPQQLGIGRLRPFPSSGVTEGRSIDFWQPGTICRFRYISFFRQPKSLPAHASHCHRTEGCSSSGLPLTLVMLLLNNLHAKAKVRPPHSYYSSLLMVTLHCQKAYYRDLCLL